MLNHDKAERLLKQLELTFDGDISLFGTQGELIITNNSKAINRKSSEISLNVKESGEVKLVTEKGVYFPLYECNEFLCTVYLSTKAGILKIIPDLVNDYLALLNREQSKNQSNSSQQQSLRELGQELVSVLTSTKIEHCRQSAMLVNVDLKIPRYVIAFDFARCLGKGKNERIDNTQIDDFSQVLYSKISKVIDRNIFLSDL